MDVLVKRAVRKVDTFEDKAALAMVDKDDHGEEVPSNPLKCRASQANNFPLLASLARRVPVISVAGIVRARVFEP